jgi:pumilio RNA-binding family
MARHKFASNVCEKALVCADSEGRRLLIDEIMSVKPDGTNTLMVIMKDQYASEFPADRLCILRFRLSFP